jgi:hypothetical protein
VPVSFSSYGLRWQPKPPVVVREKPPERPKLSFDLIDDAIMEVIRNACKFGSPAPTNSALVDAMPITLHVDIQHIPRRLARLADRGALVIEKLSKYKRRFVIADVGATVFTHNRGKLNYRR